MITSYDLAIAAPVEVVFDTASDVGAMPRFTRDVESMEFLTPAPVRLGSRVRDTRRLLGVRRSQVISFPLFERPDRFVARFAIGGVTFESDHRVDATTQGARLLIAVDAVDAAGIGHLLRYGVPLAAALVRYGIRREIEDIKVEAERRWSVSPRG